MICGLFLCTDVFNDSEKIIIIVHYVYCYSLTTNTVYAFIAVYLLCVYVL